MGSRFSMECVVIILHRNPGSGNRVFQRQRCNYDEEWTLCTESSWDTALIWSIPSIPSILFLKRFFMANTDQGQEWEGLLPYHGGYRHLKSFQVARLAYDVTVRFCDRYIEKRSRTHDQMVQAARSGVQNIAEGSVASGTSRKMELKLTNVAKASLVELALDYEDFLRHRGMLLWSHNDPRRQALVECRCSTANEVAAWVKDTAEKGQVNPDPKELRSILYPEISANAALVLVGVAITLLDRQVTTLAAAFEAEGGFTERLYQTRKARRNQR